MQKFKLQVLIEVAIMAGLALVLDLLPSIRLSASISISIAMVPVFLVALRWGAKAGMASGFLWGTLQVLMGDAWFVHPVQLIMEYFVAFTFIGFAGFFRNTIVQSYKTSNRGKGLVFLLIAILVGSLSRYFWHIIAGTFFWAEAGASLGAAFWFALWTQGFTGIAAAVLCYFVLGILFGTAPRLLTQSVKSTHIPVSK